VGYRLTRGNSSPELFDDLHKEAIFTPSVLYHSQKCYYSNFLWLKVQTDVAEGHNTRDWEDASNSRPQAKRDKVPCICQ
jgi:hypothetical protein